MFTHKHPVRPDGTVEPRETCSMCRVMMWQEHREALAEAQEYKDPFLPVNERNVDVDKGADAGKGAGKVEVKIESDEESDSSEEELANLLASIAATQPRPSGLQRAMYYALSATHPPVSRVVQKVREESYATPAERKKWAQQLTDMEAQMTGENAIPAKDLWDAVPSSILSRVAPILNLPVPDDGSFLSPDFTGPAVFWHNVPLPPEIDTINVKPDTNELSDWILAEKEYDERPEARRSKFTQGDAPRIELPSWYQLARKTAPPVVEEEAGETTPEEEPEAPSRVDSSKQEKIKVIVRKSVISDDADEEEGEEEEEKGEEHEGEEEEEKEEEKHEHLEEEEFKPKEKPHRETERQRKAREKLEEESRIQERLLQEELRRRKVRVKHFNRKLFSMMIPEEEQKAMMKSKELDDKKVDMEVHPPSTCPRNVGSFRWPYKPRNPYFNFIRKTPEKAAVWRPPDKPATSGEAMDTAVLLHPRYNLLEKANHISRAITMEFLQWMDSLGGVQESDLTEDIVEQLFDVTFDLPAAHALCVRVRELPIVPKEVADSTFAPEAEVHARLHEELRDDVEAEEWPKHNVAFGSELEICCPQRFLPPCNDVRATWIECSAMPKELATAQQVFDGITQLQSVEAFADFLNRNPRHTVPEYLRTVGLVKPKPPEPVRPRATYGNRKKRRRKRRKPPTPESSTLSSTGSSSLTSEPVEFHAADQQVLRGHTSGSVNYKFDFEELDRDLSHTYVDRDDGEERPM